MQKIWSMKVGQQKAAQAEGATKKGKRRTAAELRVLKDITELPESGTIKEPKWPKGREDDLMNFTVDIEPDEGIYKNGRFSFKFEVPQTYPHEPPKLNCLPKPIYHPNIDLEGKVCLNILREDWKPVLNLNAILVGLQFLFLEPNASDPLNKEAAEDLRQSRDNFRRNVKTAMAGGFVKGIEYTKVLKEKDKALSLKN